VEGKGRCSGRRRCQLRAAKMSSDLPQPVGIRISWFRATCALTSDRCQACGATADPATFANHESKLVSITPHHPCPGYARDPLSLRPRASYFDVRLTILDRDRTTWRARDGGRCAPSTRRDARRTAFAGVRDRRYRPSTSVRPHQTAVERNDSPNSPTSAGSTTSARRLVFGTVSVISIGEHVGRSPRR